MYLKDNIGNVRLSGKKIVAISRDNNKNYKNKKNKCKIVRTSQIFPFFIALIERFISLRSRGSTDLGDLSDHRKIHRPCPLCFNPEKENLVRTAC